jgi:hypothetical protein
MGNKYSNIWKSPASTELRELNKEIMKQGRLHALAGEFRRHGEGVAAFSEISIYRRHLNEAIKEVMSWDDSFIKDSDASVEEQWAQHDAAFKITSLSKDYARKELWRLREEGVAIRNAPVPSGKDYPAWKHKYKAWRDDVLMVAEKYDENLRPRLEVRDRPRQPPNLPVINQDHALCIKVASEILLRIAEYLP